MLLDLVFVVR